MENVIYTREELKTAIKGKYGSIRKAAKRFEISASYMTEILTGKKNGSLEIWNAIIKDLGLPYENAYMALQLLNLVHPSYK